MRTFCFALALATLASVACTFSTFSSAQTQPAAATAAADKKPVAGVTLKPKPEPAKATPCDDGQEEISLGVLAGSEADSLASTLSSVFSDNYIVTSKAAASSSSGSDPAGAGAGSKADSGSAPKHLCLVVRTNTDSSLTKKPAKGAKRKPAACSAKVPARCDFDRVLAVLDQDNFKGVTLDSNFIIKLTSATLHASTLAGALAHPTSDLDLKAVNDHWDRFLVVTPSVTVLGQASAVSGLAKHAAALKQDLLLLEAIEKENDANANALRQALQACVHCAPPQLPDTCVTMPEHVFCRAERESERWLAGHTVVLSALDPRDVILQMGDIFHHWKAVASARNHAVVILPAEVYVSDGSYLVAGAIEQDVLYRRDQAEKVAQAAADKAGSSKPNASATPVTTTTSSTTKTSVSSGAAAGAAKTPAPTTTTNTSTTTTVTPQASSAGGTAGGKSDPTSAQGQSNGSGNSGGSGGGSGGQSASQSASSTATLKGWPVGQPFPMDRVQRLYHFRHAAAIAAAINKASGSKDVDLVEPLGEADDQLLILPPTTADGHDPYNDIHRAIAMIDLPRPQLSLQVWSYEISGEVKKKNHENNFIDEQGRVLNEVQKRFDGVRQSVLTANDTMTLALQNGFGAIVSKVSTMHRDTFFDPVFYGYLTGRYQDCASANHYCLGYYSALDVPESLAGDSMMDSSLSRMLLFLVATKDEYAQATVDEALKAMEDPRCPDVEARGDRPPLCFINFRRQLTTLAQRRNLRVMRAALLDFFFLYKQLYVYFNDFVPYDLQRTAHEVDNLLNPVVDAFDQDLDDFVRRTMENNAGDKKKFNGLASKGMVHVSAISGTKAQVSGAVDNYFDITPPISLSDILNPNQNAVSALKGILEPKEITLLTAVANMGSQPRIHAQVSENVNLTITPTALDTASSAQLDVNFEVGEPTGAAPAAVDSAASKADLLNRVADYKTATQVRVESLKLFEVSSFTMELTHPQRGAPIPLIGQAWEGLFGTMPGVDKLFHFPDTSKTIDNRAIAIVRAVVVPTAMDLGQSLGFESDRVVDPVTNTTNAMLSVQQIGGKVRPFHKQLIDCVIKGHTDCWNEVKLSDMPEDFR